MGVTRGKLRPLDVVLEGLIWRYQQRVPDCQRIIRCMIDAQIIRGAEDIENDHIAFRTMGVPSLGIRSLEKIFLHYGYERRDRLAFGQKKLNAHWYSPPDPRYPRVFISELRVPDLTPSSRRIIETYTREVSSDPVDKLDLDDGASVDSFLHCPLWRVPTWDDYSRLADETEYGAWVIYNRYYLNHFTVSVHNLIPPFNSLARFNEFLKANGFRLNDAAGEIKISADGMLLQSSTVAEMVAAEFPTSGGVVNKSIAGSYVEFAERRVLPEFASWPASQIGREHRRDGFEANSADKIFESTYRGQTERR